MKVTHVSVSEGGIERFRVDAPTIEDGVNARMRELAQSLKIRAAGKYEPDHEILMSLLERYENSQAELEELARTISGDNDGWWGGGSPEDVLGHIAAYIGKIEAAQDTLQTHNFSLKQCLQDIADKGGFSATGDDCAEWARKALEPRT